MPLTWDLSGPGLVPGDAREPSSAGSSGHIPISTPEVTDPSQPFEPSEFDAEGVRTIITSPAYELRSRFVGRLAAMAELQELAARAFDQRPSAQRQSGFAVVIGEPGMG